MLDWIATMFWRVVILAVLLGFYLLRSYNRLRTLAEGVREAWSNIGVAAKKQASLVNQLIEVVKGYQESEKFTFLKISEDVSTTTQIAAIHQKAGAVVASVAGMAQRFPELKANEQYQRLIDSIQACEAQIERVRQIYNANVKAYNTQRSSIPHVFYASKVGFEAAPYLEFSGNEISADVGVLNTFSADTDGERLNKLLGSAGATVARMGNQAVASGMGVAAAAIEKGKSLIDTDKGGKAPVSTTADD